MLQRLQWHLDSNADAYFVLRRMCLGDALDHAGDFLLEGGDRVAIRAILPEVSFLRVRLVLRPTSTVAHGNLHERRGFDETPTDTYHERTVGTLQQGDDVPSGVLKVSYRETTRTRTLGYAHGRFTNADA